MLLLSFETNVCVACTILVMSPLVQPSGSVQHCAVGSETDAVPDAACPWRVREPLAWIATTGGVSVSPLCHSTQSSYCDLVASSNTQPWQRVS